jgi:hypothetical protein
LRQRRRYKAGRRGLRLLCSAGISYRYQSVSAFLILPSEHDLQCTWTDEDLIPASPQGDNKMFNRVANTCAVMFACSTVGSVAIVAPTFAAPRAHSAAQRVEWPTPMAPPA